MTLSMVRRVTKKKKVKREVKLITELKIMEKKRWVSHGLQRIRFLTLLSKIVSSLETKSCALSTVKLRLAPSWSYLTWSLIDSGKISLLITTSLASTDTRTTRKCLTQRSTLFQRRKGRWLSASPPKTLERDPKLNLRLETRNLYTAITDSEEEETEIV